MAQCQIREDLSLGCYTFVQLQQHLGLWHPCCVHSVQYSTFICFWMATNPEELEGRPIVYERRQWQDIYFVCNWCRGSLFLAFHFKIAMAKTNKWPTTDTVCTITTTPVSYSDTSSSTKETIITNVTFLATGQDLPCLFTCSLAQAVVVCESANVLVHT